MKQILIKGIGTKDYGLFFQELSNVVGEHCHSFEIDDEFNQTESTDARDSFVKSGELVRKNVSHDETTLYIDYSDEQIVIVVPHDLDDFVQVGMELKITIEPIK